MFRMMCVFILIDIKIKMLKILYFCLFSFLNFIELSSESCIHMNQLRMRVLQYIRSQNMTLLLIGQYLSCRLKHTNRLCKVFKYFRVAECNLVAQ